MAKLFDIIRDEIQLVPEVLAVPAIWAIWQRDKSRNKTTAIKELKYVVFTSSMRQNNPYRDRPFDTKDSEIRTDIFGGRSKWEPDDVVKEAIKIYKKLEETRTSRLLKAAFLSTDKLSEFLETVDLNERDNQGRLVYTANDVSRTLKELGNIVKSLIKLENEVASELAELEARGGSEIGYYENPDNIRRLMQKK